MTEKIYATDQYAREMDATIVDVDPDDGRVLLDRTVFYPGGGGQPHDVGELLIGEEDARGGRDRLQVVRVAQDQRGVWHWIEEAAGGTGPGGSGPPATGEDVRGVVDWGRRYQLMRTHTAMHALCGVVWDRFGSPVTGGNMKPGQGRLDFELPDWDSEEQEPLEDQLNQELAAARPVEIGFLPREEADQDPSLIRTKVSLLPDDLRTVRIVDIVGLDRQADGGTHVGSTREVGRVEITKVESKGKGFRRIRLALLDDEVPTEDA